MYLLEITLLAMDNVRIHYRNISMHIHDDLNISFKNCDSFPYTFIFHLAGVFIKFVDCYILFDSSKTI